MKERSTDEEDTVLLQSNRRVDYESKVGGDVDGDDDRYRISTTNPIIDAPSVCGYDNHDHDSKRDDCRHDDDDYDYEFNNDRDYDYDRDDDDHVNGGSENAKDWVHRRRYCHIYEGTVLTDKVLDGHTVVVVTTSAAAVADAVVEGEGGEYGSGFGSGDGLGNNDDDIDDNGDNVDNVDENNSDGLSPKLMSYSRTRLTSRAAGRRRRQRRGRGEATDDNNDDNDFGIEKNGGC